MKGWAIREKWSELMTQSLHHDAVGYQDVWVLERFELTRHLSQNVPGPGGAKGSPGAPVFAAAGGLKECHPQSDPVISGNLSPMTRAGGHPQDTSAAIWMEGGGQMARRSVG